jgi:hypothetical protein
MNVWVDPYHVEDKIEMIREVAHVRAMMMRRTVSAERKNNWKKGTKKSLNGLRLSVGRR